ncbi:sugar-binding transcriptional regulator [Frigidibacter sp. ROC022]|uniref:sugar-binding transcriptional regulator n=1 Tax=Frigidibacter sp. ROC022 TaxID=2971796 RepID=UPI00215B3830|nr:sugar-binding transcriptional regulator [Frigidibacter sp. ROC022]MCR8722757.1 sugar-binding transcriptional regulator [Frigidibacter sp. ROC022]
MPDTSRPSDPGNRDKASDPNSQIRVRAAWLYYIEGMTQSDVAKSLGVNRIMITRLLSEAKRRGEVVIRIQSDLAPIAAMQKQLEDQFGLKQAIVAPFSDPAGDPTRVIAYAAGTYVSGIMRSNITVGVGWGRTLHAMLPFIEGRSLEGVRVVSLLGGIAQARRFNPAEFAWQFAELFDAEGYLISAPAIVDSPQTRHALLEHCGLDQILEMAENCDVALISCGGISSLTTSYRLGHVTEAERQSMIEAGAIGDVLYNFIDAEGEPVKNPVNDRAISMSMARLKRVREKVLISGGSEKVGTMLATLKSLRPSVLITDEMTGASLLEAVDNP